VRALERIADALVVLLWSKAVERIMGIVLVFCLLYFAAQLVRGLDDLMRLVEVTP